MRPATMNSKSTIIFMTIMSVGIASAQSDSKKNLFLVDLDAPQGAIIWGGETNGLQGGVSLQRDQIHVCVRPSTNATGQALISTNAVPRKWSQTVGAVSAGQWFREAMRFLSATNSFCGPVELMDNAGNRVAPADAGLMSLSAYPPNFKYSDVERNEFKKPVVSRIIPARRITLRGDVPTPLVTFNILEMFQVKKSGQYRLTVKPIIYERSSADPDQFERVALPPVTMPIDLSLPDQ